MNKELIGKRLALLRDELAGPGEDAWTQGKVATEIGLTLNQVARLEQSAAGSIEAFVTLLLFYHQRGYNISWVLLKDNSTVSKRGLTKDTKTLDAREIVEKLSEFKQLLDKEMDTMIAEASL
jgi:hypothetical protein